MSYRRVVPRDLFNEADLLKMLGKLIIHIEERPGSVPWTYDYDGGGFEIVQDDSDGSIYCWNLRFFIAREPVSLRRPLNARTPWSLLSTYRGQEYYLFDNKGEIMQNFGFIEKGVGA